MNKFDELYGKIMCECAQVVKEDISDEYTAKVKELFVKVLKDEACDLAELEFKDESEKQAYIENAVEQYLDDIEEHIEGDVEFEKFMTLADDVKLDKVKAAIADNSEAIFGKDIFA
jgi:hypothetical protein